MYCLIYYVLSTLYLKLRELFLQLIKKIITFRHVRKRFAMSRRLHIKLLSIRARIERMKNEAHLFLRFNKRRNRRVTSREQVPSCPNEATSFKENNPDMSQGNQAFIQSETRCRKLTNVFAEAEVNVHMSTVRLDEQVNLYKFRAPISINL